MLAGVGYGDHPAWDKEYALKGEGEREGDGAGEAEDTRC